MERPSQLNREEGFHPRSSGVNRSYNVLYTFDYMAIGLARPSKIPSAAYWASLAKRVRGCVLISRRLEVAHFSPDSVPGWPGKAGSEVCNACTS